MQASPFVDAGPALKQALDGCRGYQTMINEALREYLERTRQPIDARTLRRILREELERIG